MSHSGVINRHRKALLRLFGEVLKINQQPQRKRKQCLSVQEQLIRRISYAERRIRMLKAEIRGLRFSLANRLSREESAQVKARVNRRHQDAQGYQELVSFLRQVGDALAFSYLDKWDTKPMAFKPPPGSLTGKRGSRLERKILRGAFARGHIAILNDLTNCLRYGDVTILRHGMFFLVEAKSGALGNRRARRQAAGMKVIGDYVLKDEVRGLYGVEYPIHRVELGIEERNHQHTMTLLMASTPSGHDAYLQVEEGLSYAVLSGERTQETMQRACRGCSEPLAFLVNSLKHANTGYLPFTLSVRDPGALLRFFLGEIIVVVILDLGFLKAEFLKRGIEAEPLPEDHVWSLELTDVRSGVEGRGKCRVSRHFFGRLEAEFLSLSWFIDETTHRAEEIWKGLYQCQEPDIGEACAGPDLLGPGVMAVPVRPAGPSRLQASIGEEVSAARPRMSD